MILVTPRPLPHAAHRLVVFPHAGGGPSYYHSWTAVDDVEISLVQYAGRERRMAEPPVSDPYAVVAEVCAALADGDDGRPTALFGHSMGALLAYETAAALVGGPEPSALFVSARRAPSTVEPVPLDPATGRARPRSDEEILASLREHGGTPMDLFDDPAVRELFLRVLRADYQLIESHRPPAGRPPLTLPLTALWGEQDPTADEPLMRPWAACTTGPFHGYGFDGGHFYLVPHRERVLTLIRERLGVTGAVPGRAGPRPGRGPAVRAAGPPPRR
ncbi:alpha/beta fold hydrolase [Streptomyces sp. NPDC006134]|uniref:thioesterase II family protein n=1 Tax=Streptomyces sp. NPDC006134 TaxID=3154467 RepID=UPI0033C17B82